MSHRVTKKKREHVAEVDPVVVKVQETLEENLTYFIDNIAGLVRRYDLLLGKSLQLNKGTAAEIAALQGDEAATMGSAVTSTTGAAAAASSDSAAPSPTATKKTDAPKNDDDQMPATSSDNKDVAPIVRQMTNAMPTSPLLKRAASPIGGDMFPMTGSVPASTSDSATAIAVTTTNAQQQQPSASSAAGATAGSTALDAAAAKINASKKAKKEKKKVRVVEIKFPDNTEIIKQLRLLKREAYELGATMDGIHDWIALNVPDIQDGDNDGVEVMGAVLEQVSSLNETVRSVYSAEGKYLEERSDLEKAMMKLPESDTMRLSIEAEDADTWDEIDRGWRTLIRICLLLYSILSKNMGNLKDPRKATSGASHMYM